jgi:hypothetical protein
MPLFRKRDPKAVLRAVVPYPVVLVPNHFGGFDVEFPNFPNGRAVGVNLDLAIKAAVEELTHQLYLILKDNNTPSSPSNPETLFPDDDEPAGTRVIMIEPDKDALLRRLGLLKKPRRTAPTGEKYEA